MKKLLYVVTLALAAIPSAFANPPATFTEAKVVAKQKSTSIRQTAPWVSCTVAANGPG